MLTPPGLCSDHRDDHLLPTAVGGLLVGRAVKSVSCGAFHSLALDDMGTAFWWGDLAGNTSLLPQQVGGDAEDKRIVGLSHGSMANHAALITDQGILISWGLAFDGQVGIAVPKDLYVTTPTAIGGMLEGRRVVDVSGGLEYTLSATDEGALYAWGTGNRGQLGPCMVDEQGASRRKSKTHVPTLLAGVLADKHIVGVSAGHNTCCCVTREGQLYIWGRGWRGKGGKEWKEWMPQELPLRAPVNGTSASEKLVVTEVVCGARHH